MSYFLGPPCACVALCLFGLPALAATDAAPETGFIDGSDLQIVNRNYYFNRDFRSADGLFNGRGQSYRKEWAQGVQALFTSGFTQGTVGFGVDAHALLGVKLDGGQGTSGTGLLPVDGQGRAADDYASAGAALKVRAFDTTVRVGDLFPLTPVFQYGDGRLLPQTFRGVSLQNSSFEHLTLQAARLHSTKCRASTDHDGELFTEYGGTAYDAATYLGGDYQFLDGTALSLYHARFDEVWNQTYVSLSRTWVLDAQRALTVGGNLYRTRDQGSARAGRIDTDSWSGYVKFAQGAHSVMLAYQRIDGDQPFDYLGDGDSIYLANSVFYSDFNSPNERSWQARYDFNLASVGVPGLTFMVRYLRGSDIDNRQVDANGAYAYYAALGDGGKHWERDVQVRYVVQDGPAKDLSFTVQQTRHRGNAAQVDGDVDQVRIITQYPLNLF